MDTKSPPIRKFQVSELENATRDNVIKDKTLSQGFKNGGVIQNSASAGDINAIQKYSKPSDILDKVASFRAAKLLGKKVMGAVPLLGAGYAALNGDSAMAAEELAGDVPVVGQAFEAIKPTTSGPAQGSFDDRLERGQLTDEDKMQLRQQALQRIGQ